MTPSCCVLAGFHDPFRYRCRSSETPAPSLTAKRSSRILAKKSHTFRFGKDYATLASLGGRTARLGQFIPRLRLHFLHAWTSSPVGIRGESAPGINGATPGALSPTVPFRPVILAFASAVGLSHSLSLTHRRSFTPKFKPSWRAPTSSSASSASPSLPPPSTRRSSTATPTAMLVSQPPAPPPSDTRHA